MDVNESNMRGCVCGLDDGFGGRERENEMDKS